jgi:hypothetical protein
MASTTLQLFIGQNRFRSRKRGACCDKHTQALANSGTHEENRFRSRKRGACCDKHTQALANSGTREENRFQSHKRGACCESIHKLFRIQEPVL